MADSNISKLPLPAQLLIAVVVGGMLYGGFHYFVYKDMLAQEEKMTRQLEELKKEIGKLEVITAKLADFQREVSYLELRLETLKRILPPEKETPDLTRKLQNLAAESQLRVKLFNPGAAVTRDFYQEFPIALEVDGTYHNLASFFDRMSRLTRVVNAGGLKIVASKSPNPSNTITAQCTATTYIYKEGAAAPPPDEKGGRKRPPVGKAAK
jgi:type IV pilus assembly protein PilO